MIKNETKSIENALILTPVLTILRRCVEAPIHNCSLLAQKIKNAEEQFSLNQENKELVTHLKNIVDGQDIVENYFSLQETLKNDESQFCCQKELLDSLEEEYNDKIDNSSKHYEKQINILKESNAEKVLNIQKQLDFEKSKYEEKEEQLQFELEMLEEASSFRQEILETDLTKKLVELNTSINQIKSANIDLQDKIQTLQTNANKKQNEQLASFNLPTTTGMVTPEMVLKDLPEYQSRQVFNTININLQQPSDSTTMDSTTNVDINLKKTTVACIPQNNVVLNYSSIPTTILEDNASRRSSNSTTITSKKDVDVTRKRATVAHLPQNKKNPVRSKYLPLPIAVPENNETRTTGYKNLDKENNEQNDEMKQICSDSVKNVVKCKGKKRKLFNPDADFDYLKLLDEESD